MNVSRYRMLAALVAVPITALIMAPVMTAAAALAQAELPTVFGSNYLLASALVGAFIPAVIAIINRRDWSSEAKGLMALLACLAASVLIAFTQGGLDPTDWLRSFLIVFTLAQVLYQTFWRPSGIAPSIEAATG